MPRIIPEKLLDKEKDIESLKYIKIAGIGIGVLFLLIGIPLIYMSIKNKKIKL